MWKLFSSMRKWIGNYFYFSKATLCIRGLVLSHSFVNHVVISVLITYLTVEIWKPSNDNYQLAAVAINMLDGVSSIMVCVLAFISNRVGPFKVIASTNAAYILGLVLLWSSSNYAGPKANASDKVFYGAGLLLALGEAGRPAALGKFLEDQYLSEADHKIKLPETKSIEEEDHISTRNEEQEDHISTRKEEDDKQKRVEEDKQKRGETRQTALWSHPWFIGAAAPLALVNRSWQTQLLLSMIAVGVSYLLFWYGVFAYSRNIRNESNDLAVEDAPRDPGLCQAIKSLSPPEKTPSLKFWLKPNSRKRYYKEMIVMCLAFIVYSLVEATGSTFFFNQMSLLNYHIGNFELPIIYFVILQSLSSSVISFLWRLLVPNQSKRATLVRIGCGLVCSVLCMVAAWQVEIRRKIKINTEYIGKPKPDEISMSILWLIPQFSLLGFMRGLAADGLIEFFADRVDDNGKRKARYYGSYASELVLGIGTLLTAVSIFGFRRTWLVNDIYKNRLDKYYRGLVFIGVANLCYYFCVAVYFYTKEDNSQVSCAADGNEQSEMPDEDKKYFHHGVSSGGAETPDLEEMKSSFDCCSSFF
ncbi:protein NRT1/ PTR FAMILY 5.10-like [Rosa sericea]